MLNQKIAILLFFCFCNSVSGFSQSANDTLVSNDKLKLLQTYNAQANELYNSFKNGPAFEQLQNYSVLKEKIFNEQKEAELKITDEKFKAELAARQKELATIQTSVASLKQENDSLEKEKQKLTRNTFIYFIVLIGAMAAFLFTRRKLATQSEQAAAISVIQLERTTRLSDISVAVNKGYADLVFAFKSVIDLAVKSIPQVSKLKSVATNQKKNFIELNHIEESMKRVEVAAEKTVASIVGIDQSGEEVSEEKMTTNLNQLITEVFDLSYNWIKTIDENFECGTVKDLEKILPEISIMPQSIRIALFHFFNNAFYSVYEKKKIAGKGYEPKVSVSTRKLPRFVQIRIKDNGSGIDDKVIPKIYQPFFSLKSPSIANGLGLTKGSEIIKKRHGGEIIIESEARNGTDFIIRFPINNPM